MSLTGGQADRLAVLIYGSLSDIELFQLDGTVSKLHGQVRNLMGHVGSFMGQVGNPSGQAGNPMGEDGTFMGLIYKIEDSDL